MTEIKPIDNAYTTDPKTGERYIMINISNKAIKILKSAVTWYEGDKDDENYQKQMQDIRDDIHEIWKILNPS